MPGIEKKRAKSKKWNFIEIHSDTACKMLKKLENTPKKPEMSDFLHKMSDFDDFGYGVTYSTSAVPIFLGLSKICSNQGDWRGGARI